tara:strand:- start:2202 stop:2525 length:324 start_codon:yes stop_codon:yes gene_type:complete
MKRSELRKIIREAIQEVELGGHQKRGGKSCAEKCAEQFASAPLAIGACVAMCKLKGWWDSGYAPENPQSKAIRTAFSNSLTNPPAGGPQANITPGGIQNPCLFLDCF